MPLFNILTQWHCFDKTINYQFISDIESSVKIG